jgi:predicted MFS family arabinose efflux permease
VKARARKFGAAERGLLPEGRMAGPMPWVIAIMMFLTVLAAAAGLGVLAVLQEPAFAFVGVGAFGAGFALIFPALMALTVDRVADHERGEALGSFTAFMDIGSGGGAYLIGAIADSAGFGWAYGTPALLCVAGGGLLLALGARSGQASGQTVGADLRAGSDAAVDASGTTGTGRGFVARQ